MLMLLEFVISAALLWLLLIVFDESGRDGNAQRNAMTILLIVVLGGFAAALILPRNLPILPVLAQTAILYFAILKIGENSRGATIRIVVIFVFARILIAVAMDLLT